MDLRMTFNEDAANYDRWRPTYAPDLFQDLIAYAGLGAESRALEIGIGTGQATRPILETGCHVTGLDIGGEMTAFVRQKFAQYSNFDAVCEEFERFATKDASFDLIYSATAFHWIPEDIAYPKVRRLLKAGGTLALFWNHPYRKDDQLHRDLQKAYQKYRPSEKPPATSFTLDDCAAKVDTLKQYGFADITAKLYHQNRTLQTEEYIALMNTNSDHRAMPSAARLGLEQELRNAIERNGGSVQILDTMDLYLSRANRTSPD